MSSPTTPPIKPPFPFLDLPPEIRTQILLHLVQFPFPIPICPPDLSSSSSLPALATIFPHSLLLTSSQIYAETAPLFFNTNTFVLTLRRNNTFLLPFLAARARLEAYALKIYVVRWGSNDFFVREFGPVLEDMILNGNLRRVDFVVKTKAMRKYNLSRDSEGVDNRNWVVVRRILEDPYLERGRLWVGEFRKSVWDDEMVDVTKRFR